MAGKSLADSPWLFNVDDRSSANDCMHGPFPYEQDGALLIDHVPH